VFNIGTTINVNNSYGATWLRPLTIVGARTFKFGGQVNF
jgi:hypothetical protein